MRKFWNYFLTYIKDIIFDKFLYSYCEMQIRLLM